MTFKSFLINLLQITGMKLRIISVGVFEFFCVLGLSSDFLLLII